MELKCSLDEDEGSVGGVEDDVAGDDDDGDGDAALPVLGRVHPPHQSHQRQHHRRDRQQVRQTWHMFHYFRYNKNLRRIVAVHQSHRKLELKVLDSIVEPLNHP